MYVRTYVPTNGLWKSIHVRLGVMVLSVGSLKPVKKYTKYILHC